jgi:hypothetical protein
MIDINVYSQVTSGCYIPGSKEDWDNANYYFRLMPQKAEPDPCDDCDPVKNPKCDRCLGS